MNEVIKKTVHNQRQFDDAKPKNSTKIFFKKMGEGNGTYEISNKGHIRSSNGKRKILKYQYYSISEPRINLRNLKQEQEQFYISALMKKYHPSEVKEWYKKNTNL